MDVITALARRRFLLSAWPWRGAAYLATTVATGGVAVLTLGAFVALFGLFKAALIGLPALAGLVFAGIPIGWVERWRLQLIDGRPVPDPHRAPERPGPVSWVTTRLLERATWRALSYGALLVTLLWPLDLVALTVGVGLPLALISSPLPVLVAGGHRELWPGGISIATPVQALIALPAGLVLLAAAGYALPGLAAAQAALVRKLLSPTGDELRDRLAEMARSRARLVDGFEAERRRIERDLHDGAQQRLVAVSMSLGLARLDLPPGPAADQVAHAHEQAKLALTELRDLIHGIHPHVLTQRGLKAAAEDAADRCTVPVDVDFILDHRLPAAVEATGYFVICEALSNIAKHSRANRAWLRAEVAGEDLVVEVGDDGIGGAEPGHGTGLTGLVDRVAVIGGTIRLYSPTGGPTLLRMELPCHSA